MKKLVILLASAMLLASCAFFGGAPQDKIILKHNVEMTGNGFQLFALGADVKLMAVPNPDENGKYAIKATVPFRKLDDSQKIKEMNIDLNFIDANATKVRDGFYLVAEDLDNIIPMYNEGSNVERTIVFVAPDGVKKDFSAKEASDLFKRTATLAMNVNLPVPAKAETAKSSSPLNDLLVKHNVYGRLAAYDRALRDGEKKRAKQIEDGLYATCKQVEKDPSVPEWLSDKFRDYIEDREDAIEDKY